MPKTLKIHCNSAFTARPAHLARLQQLRDENRLIVAGPNPVADSEEVGSAGFSGSVIIAEFPSLSDAKACS